MMKTCHVCGNEKQHKTWKSYTCLDCTDEGLKWCPSCETIQPISNFHKNGNTIRSFCKACECKRSITNKAENDYYSRPEVKATRLKDSSRCKRTKYKNDPEYRLASAIYSHNRRLEVSLRGTFTITQWSETLKVFGNKCAYCGRPDITQDHIVAISKGGTNTIGNIIPACGSCNSSKNNKELIEWYNKQSFYSEDRLIRILSYIESHTGGDANAVR